MEIGGGMPCSTDEMFNDDGSYTGFMVSAAMDNFDEAMYQYYQSGKSLYEGKTYYLDSCGGDEDHSAQWYCSKCDQEECGKRVCRKGCRVTDSEYECDLHGIPKVLKIEMPKGGGKIEII